MRCDGKQKRQDDRQSLHAGHDTSATRIALVMRRIALLFVIVLLAVVAYAPEPGPAGLDRFVDLVLRGLRP